MAFSRYLYRGPGFRIGEMRCPPGDELWAVECCEDNHLLGFPATSAWITKDGLDPVVADPNVVMFHDPGRPYRRSILDPRGYTCSFLALDLPLFMEAGAETSTRAGWEGAPVFPADTGSLDQASYLLKHRLLLHLRSAGRPDHLFVQEAALTVLKRAISASRKGARDARSGSRNLAPRPRTRSDWALIAEAAKAELAARLADNVSLGDLGKSVHCSPYHLARIFRYHTGRSIHEYRTQLRLRRALDLVASPGIDLASIGLGLGFSSHGHFTTSFGRLFGASPSAVRRAGRTSRSGLQEMGTIVEARVAPAS